MKNILLAVLIPIVLFSGCSETEVIEEGRSAILNPLDDDPSAVGKFETSKFEGFWQVTNNLEADWSKPPILQYPRMIYVFNKHSIQMVAGTRDTGPNESLSEINKSWSLNEFMYTNKAIYTESYVEYDFNKWRWEWYKTNYKMSADGNYLLLGKSRMVKLDVEPWSKEDIIGTWQRFSPNLYYYPYDEYNNNFYLFTYTEDTLYIDLYLDGVLETIYSGAIAIELTDEGYTYTANIEGVDQEMYEYFYIIGDKLILSSGEVLKRYAQ